MIKNNDKKGFTLIELLVVIAIIGLLSTLSILALSSARARARDTKRVSDVKQIQTALEMYFNETGAYPTTSMVVAGGSVSTTNSVFLKTVPTPPTVSDGSGQCAASQPNYTYVAYNTSGGGTYSLQYCLGAGVADIPFGLQTASQNGIK